MDLNLDEVEKVASDLYLRALQLLPPDIKAIPVARNRDNWGDADGWSERRSRQQGATYRAVTPPGYKKSKQTQTVGDIFQQVFGGF